MKIKLGGRIAEITENAAIALSVLLIAALALSGVSFITDYAMAANVTNNTVVTRVNVTNTEPNITSVSVDDDILSPIYQIDLIANSPTVVTCNATVSDYNGWQDINASGVNATFYIQSVGPEGAADNNHRYANTSCGSCRQATSSESSTPSITALCDCKLAVQYYANDSSTWICNMSVIDIGGHQAPGSKLFLSDSEISNTTTINKLLAINTSSLLDYGNLSVTETSPLIVHNVTNAGNINLNLTLRGYGGTNESIGINLTMICASGNISIGSQRYAFGTDVSSIAFASMTSLLNQTTLTNFTLPARTNDSEHGVDQNATLWRLQVPLGIGGICNGTIIFGAIDAEA